MNFNNTIQNGYFGNTQPMNPYDNIIPIGNMNYNYQPVYQPIQQYNYQPVYQPVQQYNQPQYDYNNPFGPSIQQQQQYGYYNQPMYNNGYGYPNQFNPYFSMQQRENYLKQQIELKKAKFKILCAMSGREYNDEEFDKLVNPNNPANIKSEKEQKIDREWDDVQRIVYYSQNQDSVYSHDRIESMKLASYIDNYHKAFDSHSLCEFMEEDYPRMMREFWISENIKTNANRDLSRVYSSKDYNELLNMHNSSNNPYVSTLLNQSAYDSNVDDLEIGLAQLFDAERRKRNVLEGKLPTYISSEEVQQQRRLFTQELMSQIYQKEVRQFEQS